MSSERQAIVKIDGVEVALNHHGDHILIHVNQAGVCIHRERIALIPELASGGDGVVSVETLRRLSGGMRIGKH